MQDYLTERVIYATLVNTQVNTHRRLSASYTISSKSRSYHAYIKPGQPGCKVQPNMVKTSDKLPAFDSCCTDVLLIV